MLSRCGTAFAALPTSSKVSPRKDDKAMKSSNADTRKSTGQIFISYRREDSGGYTRAIYDQLVQRFSKDRIFVDVDAIEPGLPFDEVIDRAVSHCEVLLAMVGKRWMLCRMRHSSHNVECQTMPYAFWGIRFWKLCAPLR